MLCNVTNFLQKIPILHQIGFALIVPQLSPTAQISEQVLLMIIHRSVSLFLKVWTVKTVQVIWCVNWVSTNCFCPKKNYKTFVWLSNTRVWDENEMVSAQVWWQPPGDSGVLRHKGRRDYCTQHGGRDGLVPEHDPVTFLTVIQSSRLSLSPVLLWLSDSHCAGDHLGVDDGGEGGGGEAGRGKPRQTGPKELEVALKLLRSEAGGGELTQLPQLRKLLQLRERRDRGQHGCSARQLEQLQTDNLRCTGHEILRSGNLVNCGGVIARQQSWLRRGVDEPLSGRWDCWPQSQPRVSKVVVRWGCQLRIGEDIIERNFLVTG